MQPPGPYWGSYLDELRQAQQLRLPTETQGSPSLCLPSSPRFCLSLWLGSVTGHLLSSSLMAHMPQSSVPVGLFLLYFIRKIPVYLCTEQGHVQPRRAEWLSSWVTEKGPEDVCTSLPAIKQGSFSRYSIPSCLSLMATRKRSSRRESSLMRSVMALVKASWGL